MSFVCKSSVDEEALDDVNEACRSRSGPSSIKLSWDLRPVDWLIRFLR